MSVVVLALTMLLGVSSPAISADAEWQVGMASVCITPEGPIRMAGYAGRTEPSEGVLADLYAKAMAIEDVQGNGALLITADLIGFTSRVADAISDRICEQTGLDRSQILLNPSHTHTGPVVGLPEQTGYGLEGEQLKVVHQYTQGVVAKIGSLAVAARADQQPARLSWGVGFAPFVMNRREFVDGGIRLGFNPAGYADRSVPVLRIDTADGTLRGVVFGCATHNTTLTGKHFEICGDYAGFAQAAIEERLPGVQAMFMIGCAGSGNPYPRQTVEYARQHGDTLGTDVCRVLEEELRPIHGPLQTELEFTDLPLAPVPSRPRLEEMVKGPTYLRYNAERMIEALDNNQPLLTHYRTPIALWQFGEDLTLVGMPGETVGDYVPLIQDAIGQRRLWIAGYCNDDFGYLPSAKILAQGGYETRGLIPDVGFFSPEAETVAVEAIRQLAEKAGRKLEQ